MKKNDDHQKKTYFKIVSCFFEKSLMNQLPQSLVKTSNKLRNSHKHNPSRNFEFQSRSRKNDKDEKNVIAPTRHFKKKHPQIETLHY